MKNVVVLGFIIVMFYEPVQAAGSVPIIYTADLAHPHGDPDDHFDVACLFAMREFDIRGFVFDRRPYASQLPGEAPLQQLMHITEISVPYANGLPGLEPCFESRTDTCSDESAEYQGGVELIIQQLRASAEQVDVMVVGSCRDLAAAYNREPELLSEKVNAIYLDAGRGPGGEQDEHNVDMDPLAYERLFESGLPIYWLPCWGTDGYQTYYVADQQSVVGAGSHRVQKYFEYCFTRSTADPIEFLSSPDPAPPYPGGRRMWCTPGLIAAAGRKIYQRDDNDYVALSPEEAAIAGLTEDEISVFEFVPMQAEVNSDGSLAVTLNPSGGTNSYVFHVTDSSLYQQVMSSCLKNLVAELEASEPEPPPHDIQLVSPVAVPYSSGAPYEDYYAETAIDGDVDTFCVLFDDTDNGSTPTTGHMVFDLGEVLSVGGVKLTSREFYRDYNPKDIDIFYFADDNPHNNTLIDDIENDSDIVLIKSHSYPSLVNGAAESLAFPSTLDRRYIGMRVNSSWEEGPTYWNFQIAEVEFFLDAGVLAGDLNGDGFVGGDDLDIVRSFWGQNVTAGNLLQGDPSNDGFVGGDDLDIVRANWGQGTPPGPASVPEPGAILLMLWLAATALVLMSIRRKRIKA